MQTKKVHIVSTQGGITCTKAKQSLKSKQASQKPGEAKAQSQTKSPKRSETKSIQIQKPKAKKPKATKAKKPDLKTKKNYP